MLKQEQDAPGCRSQEERDLTMYGPYGSMMENWGQMWQWMWQMQLVWVLPLLIVVALVAFIARTRIGGPKTPTPSTPASRDGGAG